MKVLLDTCFLSELVKPEPNAGVRAWIMEHRRYAQFCDLSVVTIGEIEKGIVRLPASDRRSRLIAWLESDILVNFSGRILPVSLEIARVWGRLESRCRSEGIALQVADGLIAATALVHELQVVTHNTGDFAPTGVGILNPWSGH